MINSLKKYRKIITVVCFINITFSKGFSQLINLDLSFDFTKNDSVSKDKINDTLISINRLVGVPDCMQSENFSFKNNKLVECEFFTNTCDSVENILDDFGYKRVLYDYSQENLVVSKLYRNIEVSSGLKNEVVQLDSTLKTKGFETKSTYEVWHVINIKSPIYREVLRRKVTFKSGRVREISYSFFQSPFCSFCSIYDYNTDIDTDDLEVVYTYRLNKEKFFVEKMKVYDKGELVYSGEIKLAYDKNTKSYNSKRIKPNPNNVFSLTVRLNDDYSILEKSFKYIQDEKDKTYFIKYKYNKVGDSIEEIESKGEMGALFETRYKYHPTLTIYSY